MTKKLILSIIMAAGLSLLIMEAMPSKKKAVRMYRSMRASGRRTRKDILDIYED
jgi:hypothetical protein